MIAVGNSGTGKTHMALGLGLDACQKGMSVGFTTAAALVHELMEARDERRLLNLQRQLSRLNLLIIDELGFVPLSTTGAELLFEVFSQRYERGSILVTTNLPFDEWTEVFGSERLGASHRSVAGPPHPPRPHPGDEWRELPAEAQPGERRLASSREAGRRITHCQRCPPSCSCNVATLTDSLQTVIRPVVHGYSATVACYRDALDTRQSTLPPKH